MPPATTATEQATMAQIHCGSSPDALKLFVVVVVAAYEIDKPGAEVVVS